jgi:O-succinylbenzoic acid--CoA ligase
MADSNWLTQRAAAFGDREALATAEGSLTFAELEAEAMAEAERLAGTGVRPGNTAALSMPAGRDYAIRLHALGKLGAAAMPLDPRLSPPEMEKALAKAEAAPADPRTHSRIFTGGTTGDPKLVDLTAANHYWSAVGSALNLGVDAGDRWLCCLPLFHVSGLTIVMRSVIYGTSAVIHDGFDADRVAAELETGGISIVSLVATQLARLLETGAEVSSPRVLLLGGGPLPRELLEEAEGRGATVAQTYGMTETCSQVATLSPADVSRKLGSAGRPLLSSSIRTAEDGEILVKGPTVAPGAADADGWLHTGDLGRFDEDGFLWVTGRSSETIVTGGENVMPREIEDVLRSHPAVADVAVIGRPDPEWQEAVTALIVWAGEPVPDDELRAHAAVALAPFKVPKRFESVESLPRTVAGKLRRAELA